MGRHRSTAPVKVVEPARIRTRWHDTPISKPPASQPNSTSAGTVPRRSTAPARQNHGRGIPPRWTLPLCTGGPTPWTRAATSPPLVGGSAGNSLLAVDRRTKQTPESRDTRSISSCLGGDDKRWRDLWGAQTLAPIDSDFDGARYRFKSDSPIDAVRHRVCMVGEEHDVLSPGQSACCAAAAVTAEP